MADATPLTHDQWVYLLLHNPLTPIEEAQITDMVTAELDAGLLDDPLWRKPVTIGEVIERLQDPNGHATDQFRIKDNLNTLRARGSLPTVDAHVTDPGVIASGPASSIDDWVVRVVRSAVNTITSDPGVVKQWQEFVLATDSDLTKGLFRIGMDVLKTLVKAFAEATAAATPIAGELAGETMNQILGVDVKSKKLFDAFTGPPSREAVVTIGEEFQKVVTQMFPLEFSRDNVLDRGKRDWSQNNLAAFMGTNMAFQLRSLTIGTIASFVPGFNLEHLEGLHQSINWAYGFGFLSWTVISAVMNVTTTKPLTEYYNSQVLGNDLTEGDALKAFVEKRISDEQLQQTLNNLGVRKDIRDHKIDMTRKGLTTSEAVHAFIQGHIDEPKFQKVMDREGIRDDERQVKVEITRPDLSEGNLIELYNRGERTESDLTAYYKEKGYDDGDVARKVLLAKNDRLWKLQDQLAVTYYRAFVKEFVEEEEYTQYLKSLHYSDLEVQIELKRAEVQRKEDRELGLTKGEILRLTAHGDMSAADGLARLIAGGIPDPDARMLLADAILEHAVAMVPPKVRNDCLTDQVRQNLFTNALEVAISIDPLYAIRNKDFWAQAQCILQELITNAGGTPGGPPPPPPPVLPPAPQTLVAAPGTGSVFLSWQPIPGLADYQVYRRQIGSGFFGGIGAPSTATNYVDTSVVRGEIYIYVVRAQVNGLESLDSNEVQVLAV